MSPLLLIITLVATAFSVAVSGAKVPSDSECYSAYNSIGQDAMYVSWGASVKWPQRAPLLLMPFETSSWVRTQRL